jgi:hypothetical protein
MYTLRIINQIQNGAEERRNVFLGNAYDVLLKTPVEEGKVPAERNRFNKAIEQYYGVSDANDTHAIDQTIIGFIYSEDKTYPIRDFEVVYIVNQEGTTIERVYGMYQKY